LAGFFMPATIVRIDTVNCGSEPAREDGLTFDIDIDCPTAFASRLAPTGGICLAIGLG
jgi:hypothetical protein